MARLRYRHPTLSMASFFRIVDPDDINDDLEDVARLVNGNLGIENMAPGQVFAPANLKNGASLVAMSFDLDTFTGPAAPANMQLLKMPVAGRLDAIVAYNASSGLLATLRAGPSGSLTDRFQLSYPGAMVTQIVAPQTAALSVNDIIALNITAGTVVGLTLYLAMDHSA